uniref:Uncharacterized protein n=1 Tax=Arundo donax TaxID=35708 RepID=A0A0A9E0W4_ARUDO
MLARSGLQWHAKQNQASCYITHVPSFSNMMAVCHDNFPYSLMLIFSKF